MSENYFIFNGTNIFGKLLNRKNTKIEMIIFNFTFKKVGTVAVPVRYRYRMVGRYLQVWLVYRRYKVPTTEVPIFVRGTVSGPRKKKLFLNFSFWLVIGTDTLPVQHLPVPI